MDVDPLASMRCWAITVELGGREYDIPALPAVDWWPVLIGADTTKFLDLLTSSSDVLDLQLLDGTVTGKELSQAFQDVIEEVTGRSLHVAFVLVTVAASQWPTIGGHLARTGFRWDVQPIGAALDAVYAVVSENLDKENRDKFLKLLENEHLTTGVRKRPDQAKIMSEFEAMAGPRPAPAPVPARSTGEPSGSAPPKTPRQPRPRRPAARSS